MNVYPHPASPRIFTALRGRTRLLLTEDLSPSYSVYGEEKLLIGSTHYRVWDPFRSKLASAVLLGLPVVPVRKGDAVLYLGAATGTTASHISDVVGTSGVVYCVEVSPKPFGDLIRLTEQRTNVIPILGDARNPRSYVFWVGGVDVLYCDVAQPDQVEIVCENASLFLRSGGHLLHAVKASSVDSSVLPEQVYEDALSRLSEGFAVRAKVNLERYQKKHVFVWGVYK